jgi:hypothetical protein
MKALLHSVLCVSALAFPRRATAQVTSPGERQDRAVTLIDLTASELNAIEEPTSITVIQLIDFPGDGRAIRDESFGRLRRFPRLKTLIVGCPRLTDEGVAHVAKLKELQCLVIYDSHVTDEGIRELKALPDLKVAAFHQTRVTDAGVQDLKTALRHTHIELGVFGKNGSVFDANGCVRPQFLKEHLGLQRRKGK